MATSLWKLFSPGFLLITAGILLLLNTLNLLPFTVWNYIWQFWPLILIFWGIQLLFGFSPFGRVIINILGLLIVVLVVLFAIYQVSPQLLKGSPPVFDQIFMRMKGVQR